MHSIRFDGLVFRAFEDSDAGNFAAAARESVASVGKWMSWCHSGFSELDALNWVRSCRANLATGSSHEFGIFSEQSGQLLGGAGLNSINGQHLFCNLGYWVRQSAQGQGVAFRSVQALAPYAFDVLGMRRIEIVVACGNTASERVARRAGARLECVARNRLNLHGVSVPASVFSLVPEPLSDEAA